MQRDSLGWCRTYMPKEGKSLRFLASIESDFRSKTSVTCGRA